MEYEIEGAPSLCLEVFVLVWSSWGYTMLHLPWFDLEDFGIYDVLVLVLEDLPLVII